MTAEDAGVEEEFWKNFQKKPFRTIIDSPPISEKNTRNRNVLLLNIL